MARLARYMAQALLFAALFVPLAVLTQRPVLRHLPEDTAVLKLAVRQAGAIVGECTPVGAGAQPGTPANMRTVEICPRERSPLRLELTLDGETLLREAFPASGLHNDGVSSMYRRFQVPAGTHRLQLRMNDDQAVQGHTWELDEEIHLEPAQVMVATFREGFRLQ